MLIMVGLGNPGPKYTRNRHNIGYVAVDAIHRRFAFGPWRKRFQAEIAEGTLGDRKCLLVKPLTYMNKSGQAVGEVATFYKVAPADVFVIHDEVDLPPGKIRMKTGGGAGGHNGLRSVTAAIGDGFRRLRIGVGHPGSKELVPTYVLHDFAKADGAWIDPLIEAIADYAPLIAEGKDSTFSNRIHERLAAPASGGKDDGGKDSDKKAESKPAASSATSAEPSGPFAGLKRLFGIGD
jgi:PTH1 family peptidyl-tRNA hydrolase